MRMNLKGLLLNAATELEGLARLNEQLREMEAAGALPDDLTGLASGVNYSAMHAYSLRETATNLQELIDRMEKGDGDVIREFFDLYCVKYPSGKVPALVDREEDFLTTNQANNTNERQGVGDGIG